MCFDCLHHLFISLLLFYPPFFSFSLPSPFSSLISVLYLYCIRCLLVIIACHFYQAAFSIKISNLLICFCSFDLSCPVLEKDIFIENLCIVVSLIFKIAFLFVSSLFSVFSLSMIILHLESTHPDYVHFHRVFWLPQILFLLNVIHIQLIKLILIRGAGCRSEVERSLMVRWVVGSILHGVDPLSYFSFQPVLHDWCNKGCGMCYPVCGMVHIKEPLLLIDKSSLCVGSGFPFSLSEWSSTII